MNRGPRLVLATLVAPLSVPLVVFLFFESSNDAIWAEMAFLVSGVIAYGTMLFLGVPFLLYLRGKGFLHTVGVVLSGTTVGIIVGLLFEYTILLKAGSSRPLSFELIAWSAGAGLLVGLTFSIVGGLSVLSTRQDASSD